MVIRYSPEPPQRDSDEGFIIEGAGVMVMDSSEDDDTLENNLQQGSNFEYELLPQDVPAALNGEENGDSDSSNTSDNGLDSQLNGVSTENGGAISYAEMMTTECSNRPRPEIEINADEVRAAMRNVVLPPSSFPAWATSISESQLTEYVLMRINRRPNNSPRNADPPAPP